MQGITTNKLILGSAVLSNTGQVLYLDNAPISIQSYITKTTVFYNSAGISSGIYTFPIWRAPYDCVVTGVHGLRISGSGALINARRNFSNTEHLINDLSLTSTGVWISSGSILDASYSQGDTLEGVISSTTGTPLSISIQVDFIKSGGLY
jgi:hypothetical protein